MVHLSRKTQKNAGTAEVQKPKTSEKPSPKTKKAKKPTGFQVPPALREFAKSLGIDADAIAKNAAESQARLENLEKAVVEIANHIQDSDKNLAPLLEMIKKAKEIREQAQTSGAPVPTNPQGQSAMGLILQMLPALIGGGGGENPMMKRMMEMSLKRMEADIGFTEAIKNVIVTKIAGKAAADLV